MLETAGMKQSEIGKCAACNQGIAHSNQLTFYHIRSRYMILDVGAIQRADGMEQMMGGGNFGAMIQQAMGRDEDLAKQVSEHTLCVCLQCAMTLPIAAVMEAVVHREEEKDRVDEEKELVSP